MDIQKEVIQIIAQQLNYKPEDIQLKNKFIDHLKADSLDVVEIIMAFEEKFDIQIPDEEAEKFQSVGQVVEYIKKKKA